MRHASFDVGSARGPAGDARRRTASARRVTFARARAHRPDGPGGGTGAERVLPEEAS